VARIEPCASEFGYGSCQIKHRGRNAGAHVEDERLRGGRFHRSQKGGDDIGDIDKIARLFPVAEDIDRRPTTEAFTENRDDCSATSE
jgi:hypothetical protein